MYLPNYYHHPNPHYHFDPLFCTANVETHTGTLDNVSRNWIGAMDRP